MRVEQRRNSLAQQRRLASPPARQPPSWPASPKNRLRTPPNRASGCPGITCRRCTGPSSRTRLATTWWLASPRGPGLKSSTPSSSATGAASGKPSWTFLEKARVAYHKCCQKEQNASDKEKRANEGENWSPEKRQKLTEAREVATLAKEKARERYEKILEDVTSYTPRYMEEMEVIFEESQEEERKRISFLKQAFLSIHRHLDITNNESIKEVYNELHQTLMAVNEQEDLKWWKNHHGPGMLTNWPKIQEWHPPVKKLKRKKRDQKANEGRPVMIGGVKVRALYDYTGEEGDELSFKAGEEFLKVEEEDDQGWCRGVLSGGKEGFYPANYVELIE
ncbi:protein kinase C and casein kinase substrate in neurons protein 1-like isoform X2 [Syngnathoides biaculeatus]|uniref:protein kinase C and casein kinase substrate in neurons protein 1-like isoform X2 n=1 Tax=Syngnathoides biaculeatus TaxID=300417 RepID=UPI002ADE722A|nr:protein kinase C and casein kinase substrate in neurons protein 1-like isoform X2 [Syngnathoides biaculeatus]